MENNVSDPRVVPSDRRALGGAPIKPCRSHALGAGTVKLPSFSLRLLDTRAVYLRAFRPLIAKNNIFYRNSSVHLLIRLTGLPAEVLYARGSSYSYLCSSCHVFLAIKLREDEILCIALGTIYLLNATEYYSRRWSRSGAIESEVIVYPVRDLSKRKGSISGAIPSRKLDRMVHINGQFTPNDPCEETRSSNRPVLDPTPGIYYRSANSRLTRQSHCIL
jgi:hypothetical protein